MLLFTNTRKQELSSIIDFSHLILTNSSLGNPPVYLVTMVAMGPVGVMKSTRKQKLFIIIGFILEFFSNSFRPLEVSEKVLVGWGWVF